MSEYHKCSNCKKITYGLDGYIEMVKHTNQCKKSKSNSDGITCLFTTYRGNSNVK